VKAILKYAGAALLLIAALFALLSLVFRGEGAREALFAAAGTAFVVQLLIFTMMRTVAQENVMMARGAGALARLVALGIFAAVVVTATQLPPMPALLGLAAYFFGCTVLESLFLG
jgi:hypothetical protein